MKDKFPATQVSCRKALHSGVPCSFPRSTSQRWRYSKVRFDPSLVCTSCHFFVLEPCSDPRNSYLLLLLLLCQKSIAEQEYFSEKNPTEECPAPCEPWYSIWAWALNSVKWQSQLKCCTQFAAGFLFSLLHLHLLSLFLINRTLKSPSPSRLVCYYPTFWVYLIYFAFTALLITPLNFFFFIPRSDGVCVWTLLCHIILSTETIFLKRDRFK